MASLEYGFVSASQLMERQLKVDGHCSLSIFAGSGGMSIPLALAGVFTICPWEVEKDNRLDVIKNASVLWRLARSGRVLVLMAGNALQELDTGEEADAKITGCNGR